MTGIDETGPALGRSGGAVSYEVFNADYSVGVACDRVGVVIGIHVGEEIWEHTDSWLAAEILRVARFAHAKSLLGKRLALLATGAPPQVADSRGLPTEAEYRRMAQAEFGDTGRLGCSENPSSARRVARPPPKMHSKEPMSWVTLLNLIRSLGES